MNRKPTQSLTSLAIAAALTLSMLLGINGLATSEVPAAQLARVTATAST